MRQDLYFYHFQLSAQALNWTCEKWTRFRADHPDHVEMLEAYNEHWSHDGVPTLPLPEEGDELREGGVATAEWLADAKLALGLTPANDCRDTEHLAGGDTPGHKQEQKVVKSFSHVDTGSHGAEVVGDEHLNEGEICEETKDESEAQEDDACDQVTANGTQTLNITGVSIGMNTTR